MQQQVYNEQVYNTAREQQEVQQEVQQEAQQEVQQLY